MVRTVELVSVGDKGRHGELVFRKMPLQVQARFKSPRLLQAIQLWVDMNPRLYRTWEMVAAWSATGAINDSFGELINISLYAADKRTVITITCRKFNKPDYRPRIVIETPGYEPHDLNSAYGPQALKIFDRFKDWFLKNCTAFRCTAFAEVDDDSDDDDLTYETLCLCGTARLDEGLTAGIDLNIWLKAGETPH